MRLFQLASLSVAVVTMLVAAEQDWNDEMQLAKPTLGRRPRLYFVEKMMSDDADVDEFEDDDGWEEIGQTEVAAKGRDVDRPACQHPTKIAASAIIREDLKKAKLVQSLVSLDDAISKYDNVFKLYKCQTDELEKLYAQCKDLLVQTETEAWSAVLQQHHVGDFEALASDKQIDTLTQWAGDSRLKPNRLFMVKKKLEAANFEVQDLLKGALGKFPTSMDLVDQYDAVINDRGSGPALKALAEKMKESLEREMKKLEKQAELAGAQGKVSVSAAIKGMSMQLSQIISENKWEEEEEVVERWESMNKLAGSRGVDVGSIAGVDAKAFKDNMKTLKQKVEKHKEDAEKEISSMLAAKMEGKPAGDDIGSLEEQLKALKTIELGNAKAKTLLDEKIAKLENDLHEMKRAKQYETDRETFIEVASIEGKNYQSMTNTEQVERCDVVRKMPLSSKVTKGVLEVAQDHWEELNIVMFLEEGEAVLKGDAGPPCVALADKMSEFYFRLGKPPPEGVNREYENTANLPSELLSLKHRLGKASLVRKISETQASKHPKKSNANKPEAKKARTNTKVVTPNKSNVKPIVVKNPKGPETTKTRGDTKVVTPSKSSVKPIVVKNPKRPETKKAHSDTKVVTPNKSNVKPTVKINDFHKRVSRWKDYEKRNEKPGKVNV